MIEGGCGDPTSAEPIDAVVATTDSDRLLFQPAEHLPDGGVPGGLDFRPHFRAASGGQQAHTLRIRKRQIKGRHARVDPLADIPACLRNSCAIQFLGISIKDCPTHSIRYNG
jgi:hypothetical protein